MHDTKQAAAIIAVIVLVVIALAAGQYAFVSPEPASLTVHSELNSAVDLFTGRTVSDEAVAAKKQHRRFERKTRASSITLNREPTGI